MNKHRSYKLFKDFYFNLLDELVSKHSFARKGLLQLKRKIYLLDALHAVLDYDGCLPVFAQVTEGGIHEINIAHTINFPKGSVIVADRGYVDFKWLKVLDSRSCFFVTRAKSNMAFHVHQCFDVKGLKSDGVLEEQHVSLTGHKAKKHYPGKLRLIRYLDSITGKEYVFMTNNFTWKAKTVADIYKERWHIEVFFYERDIIMQ